MICDDDTLEFHFMVKYPFNPDPFRKVVEFKCESASLYIPNLLPRLAGAEVTESKGTNTTC